MALSLKKPALGPKLGKIKLTSAKASKVRKEQFVLFVGDEGAILIYMQASTVVRRLFAPTALPEHTKTMVDLMAQHPAAPVSMVFDVLDQQYVRQTFPPVSALSVEGLVRRRLERDFPPEDLRGSLRVGREETQRKDWIYLLISLANTANYQQWVDLIVEQPNRLLGLHLMPVEAQNFIPLLAQSLPSRPEGDMQWQLLVSHHKVSGFRIVVLREGKLAFTRVSQAVGEDVAAVVAGNVEQEIQNTIEYIRRLGYSESMGLEVFAILSSDVRDSIDTSRISASGIHLLSPVDVSDLLELSQAALAADRYGDVVVASGFGVSKKSPLRLYPAYAKKLDQLFQARQGARVVAGGLAALFLFMAGSSVLTALNAMSESRKAVATYQSESPTLALLQQQVDKLGSEVNFKNDMAAFYNKVKPDELSPLEALKEVYILKHPILQLEDWSWSQATTVPSADGTLPPPTLDASGNPLPPVQIKLRASLRGSYPDNDTINNAVETYKTYLNSALKNYSYEIDGAAVAGESGGKVSVALETNEQPSAENQPGTNTEQSPALGITLTGPKPATPQNQSAPGAATSPTPMGMPMGAQP